MEYTNAELMKILETGVALSKERDSNRLLDRILSVSMEITGCDGGALYVYQNGSLHCKLRRTLSLPGDRGGCGEGPTLPPVEMNAADICAYCVRERVPVNIADAYENTEFHLDGLRKYDELTGYRTKSMLTVPLNNQEEAVGVLQLINAMDGQGRVIPFARRYERIVLALASQSAIAMSNIRYVEEIKAQMWSFTEAMAETIDARTPYNAHHVRMVADYAGMIADYINKLHDEGKEEEFFSQNRREQLVLGALLHDIGKIAVPTAVMNKSTRLEGQINDIRMRFELFAARYRIQWLEGRLSKQEYEERQKHLREVLALVEEVNTAGFLTEEKRAQVKAVLEDTYRGEEGESPFFTQEEKECLQIVKGTLTAREREIMEGHVGLTERILGKVHFNAQYAQAVTWAAQHHEYLDGTGYPRGLRAKQLATEARILAVADICDALLATDRPYKKPLPRDKAFAIMYQMAQEGKLDGRLVGYLEKCIEVQ